MGANNDHRIIEMVPGKTLKELFGGMAEDLRYEHGSEGYSGTLGEKRSYVIVGQNPAATLDQLRAGGRLVGLSDGLQNTREIEALFAPPTTQFCCYNGKTTVRQEVTLADGRVAVVLVEEPHAPCGGTGVVPISPERAALATRECAVLKDAYTTFFDNNPAALRRAGAVFAEKRGPAAALTIKNFVWFGGTCAS
jgi:hypothetical protein